MIEEQAIVLGLYLYQQVLQDRANILMPSRVQLICNLHCCFVAPLYCYAMTLPCEMATDVRYPVPQYVSEAGHALQFCCKTFLQAR